jgi:hypothetical protein
MDLARMHKEGEIEVSAADCAPRKAMVAVRNSRQKRIWWPRVILASDRSCGTAEIMR